MSLHNLEADEENRSTIENNDEVEGRDVKLLSHPAEKPLDDIRKSDENGDSAENIVFWDSPDDPNNPYNWPRWKTIVNCTLLGALAFVTPIASSFFAPGVPQLMREFHSDNDLLATFIVSVYVLGFAFGPLVLAPMSEIFGRAIVYHVCNVGFVVLMVACAEAPSLNALIGFRFLSGIFGSCPLANANGSVGDMVRQEKRATAIGAITIGPLLGPVIGPIAGGFLSAAKGWRWVFWVLAIVSGALSICMLLFLKESYAPVLLQRKVKRLQRETGNYSLRSKLDAGLTASDLFKRAVVRPITLLCKAPLVLVFAVYMGVAYGYLYLLFTSITEVFEGAYGFSTSVVGLSYLGIGVGTILALIIYTRLSDKAVQKAIASQGGTGSAKPELRLALLPAGAIILPAGFFVYGWTAQYRVQWIVPIIGLGLIGIGEQGWFQGWLVKCLHANLSIGAQLIFMAITMYLIDAYLLYAASAIAALTVIRSIGGALLPLAALDMYAALGLGWGNSLLGFIAIAIIPVPLIIMRYGERMRDKFKIENI